MALPVRPLYLSVVRPGPVRHDGPGTEGVAGSLFGRGLGQSCLAERGPLLQQELLQRERKVVQEVPAVGDLHGAGGALGEGLP